MTNYLLFYSFKPILVTHTDDQCSDHLVYLSIERIQFSDCKGRVSASPVEWQKELTATSCEVDVCKIPGNIAKPSTIAVAPTVSDLDVQYMESEQKIRVYLYGKALVPTVKLRPTEVIIESIPIGSTAEREVCLTNTEELPIHVSFRKATNIYVTPSHVFLKPTRSVEVLLTVKPTATGHTQQKLWFTLLAKTWPPIGNPCLAKVGSVCLPITYDCPAVTTIPKTVFTMGITPIITNEIGVVNERITFSSGIEKPRAALVTPVLWQKVPPGTSRFPQEEAKIVVETLLQKSLQNECEELYDSYASSSDEGNTNLELLVPLKHSKRCYKQKVILTTEYTNGRLEDSLIAFPNDRSKSLRPWPKHKITRYTAV
ncbi:uncharacterized protein LOC126481711 [Schistocerca serialis cubense]|uniref:uncharacterized protein LOC126481711 n=1 Tax=Schistocerca serialis cubense TaxID=2023355 RepID=UPI00214E4DE0|nr:uncharacterized protein LOC126481711 [Schistocerca serialis cubense]